MIKIQTLSQSLLFQENAMEIIDCLNTVGNSHGTGEAIHSYWDFMMYLM